MKDDDCEGFDTDSFCEWLINHPEEKRDFQAGRKAFKEDLSACESLIYGMTYIITYDIHDADEVIGWFLGATKQYVEENC